MNKKGDISGARIFMTVGIFVFLSFMWINFVNSDVILFEKDKNPNFKDYTFEEVKGPISLYNWIINTVGNGYSNLKYYNDMTLDRDTVAPWVFTLYTIFILIPLGLMILYYIRGFI